MSKSLDILPVEDNPADVRLTQEAFREGKILNNLMVAKAGVEAMDLLHRRGKYAGAPRPDLILLDLNLLRKDGREVLAEVKSDPALMRIPVVVPTTSRAEMDIIKGYNFHANCCIVKPVDLDPFVSVIKSIDKFRLTAVTPPGEVDE